MEFRSRTETRASKGRMPGLSSLSRAAFVLAKTLGSLFSPWTSSTELCSTRR